MFGPGRKNIVVKKKATFRGYFQSNKLNRRIAFESNNEFNACKLIEVDPGVTDYKEQPAAIPYELNGRSHTYYPDFWVKKYGQETFVEVKPAEILKDPEIRSKYGAIEEALKGQGYKFTLLADDEAAKQPRLRNSELLLRYARSEYSHQDVEAIKSLFIRSREVTLQCCFRALKFENSIQKTYAMVCAGVLLVNTGEEDINSNTIVTLAK